MSFILHCYSREIQPINNWDENNDSGIVLMSGKNFEVSRWVMLQTAHFLHSPYSHLVLCMQALTCSGRLTPLHEIHFFSSKYKTKDLLIFHGNFP
jgi:hypothetical protein